MVRCLSGRIVLNTEDTEAAEEKQKTKRKCSVSLRPLCPPC